MTKVKADTTRPTSDDDDNDGIRREFPRAPARYAIVDRAGDGGMGVVYRAYDRTLGRMVALKWVLPGQRADRRRNARLLFEARAAAAIGHPNAVAVFDAEETSEGSVFIVMEHVRGSTLRALLRSQADLPFATRLDWLRTIAEVLAAAHRRGIVHGDVKPENVIVRDDGVLKVLDFGIARAMHGPVDAAAETVPLWLHAGPREGRKAGTAGYAAPEQRRGEPIDGRADQFSWGVLSFELLTGAWPWPSIDAESRGVRGDMLALRAPDISDEIAAVIARAMEPEPASRFSSMAALLEALSPAASPTEDFAKRLDFSPSRIEPFAPATPPSVGWGAAALAAFVIAIGVGFGSTHRGSPTGVSRPITAAKRAPETSAPSSDEAANAAYAAGMQAARDASREMALANFARATSLDDGFAAAHLMFVTNASVVDDDVREHARRALAGRAQLSAHDHTLLDAYLQWTSVPQNAEASAHVLVDALARRGDDADFAFHLCRFRTFLGEYWQAIDACERALRIDPTLADALRHEGLALLSLDETARAREIYERCLAVSPTATRCLRDLAELELAGRRCDAVVPIARRLIALDPSTPDWFRVLAWGLFGAGESLDSVKIALAQGWQRRPPARRPVYEAAERAALAIAIGDFTEGQAQALRYRDAVASSPEEVAHLEPTDWLVNLALERGATAEAVQLSDAYDRRRSAWAPSPYTNTRIYVARWKYQAGALSRREFLETRGAWLTEQERRPPATGAYGAVKGREWVLAYAFPSVTTDDGREALEALPAYLPLPAAFIRTDEDESIGRTYLLAGHAREAIMYLRPASSKCASVAFPFEAPRAAYQLGRALEAQGQVGAACEAYATVLERWPLATTRSQTSASAASASARLGCAVVAH